MKQVDSTRNHFSRDLIISQPFLHTNFNLKKYRSPDRQSVQKEKKTSYHRQRIVSAFARGQIDGRGLWIKDEGPG